LDPNSAEAYAIMAANYGFMEKWDECLRYVQKGLELDPLSVKSGD